MTSSYTEAHMQHTPTANCQRYGAQTSRTERLSYGRPTTRESHKSEGEKLTPNLSFSECIPRYFARENRYLYQEEPGIFSRYANQQSGTPIRRADQTIQHLYLVTKTKEKKKIPYQACRSTIRYPYLAIKTKTNRTPPSFPASIKELLRKEHSDETTERS